MAENPIRKEDIIDIEDIHKSFEQIISDVLRLSNAIGEDLTQSIQKEKAAVEAADPATKEGQKTIKDNSRAINDNIQNLNRLNKVREQFITQAKKSSEAIKIESGSYLDLQRRMRDLERQAKSTADEGLRKSLSKEAQNLNKQLKDLDAQMGKHQRNVGNYKQSIIEAGRSLAGFLGIAGGGIAILNKLKDAFADTEQGVRFFKRGAESLKAFFNNLVTGNVQMAGVNAAAVWEISKQWDEIRKGDRQDLIEIARMEAEIQKLRLDASKAGLSEAETLRLITIASNKENELIDYKIKDKQEELDVVKQLLPFMQDNTTLLDKEAQLTAEIITLQSDKSLRIAREKASLEERVAAAKEKQKAAEEEKAKFLISAARMIDIPEVEVAKATAVELKNIDNKKLIDRTEWYNKQKQLTQEAARQELIIEEEKERQKQELYAATFNTIVSLSNLVASTFERSKQRELKAAGDNAQERERIEKEYGEKEKNWAITMAVINGALAITQAWANEKTWYVALARSVAAAAATALEISEISSQKFAEGGDVIGKPHSMGGVPLEAEGGEYIINRKSTFKYHDLIKAINEDDPMRIADELRNRQFHTVWGGIRADLSEIQKQDPYTRMIYELMRNDVKIYTDSNGDTVIRHPDGSKQIIRKYQN